MSDDNQDNLEVEAQEERPEWLPSNFKSPEDLAKSYLEAQRKITELGNHSKNLEENYADLAAQVEQLTAQQRQPDPANAHQVWQDMYDNDPITTQWTLAQQAAAQAVEQYQKQFQNDPRLSATYDLARNQATANLRARYEDFAEYSTQVGEVIQQLNLSDEVLANPAVLESTMENAYKIARYDDLTTKLADREKSIAESAAAKRAAQTVTGSQGRPMSPDAVKAEWDAIKAAGDKPYWQQTS